MEAEAEATTDGSEMGPSHSTTHSLWAHHNKAHLHHSQWALSAQPKGKELLVHSKVLTWRTTLLHFEFNCNANVL
jgi:hypothetical protein